MTPAGYSGTPLIRKLGIRAGMRLLVVDAPGHYRQLLGDLPEDVRFDDDPADPVPFIHVFVRSRAELEERVAAAMPRMTQDGMLWVSWPKKASKVPTDVTEDVVRAVAIPAGLVDVKVCAVDDVWSGLKLVIPLHRRGAAARG